MRNRRALILLAALELACPLMAKVRLKDLVTIEGVRDNQLVGYGLVVGLAGTGDKRQTVFATQTLANILDRMGVTVSPTAIQAANVASVMITANLPPFAQTGTKLDVTVAAIGDSRSLQGGLLLITPLKGPDGQVYAVAQGQVVTGGFVAGPRSNNQTVNHPTTGRIPSGGIIERQAPSVSPGASMNLQLRQPDFTTAARIAKAINEGFPGPAPIATAANSAVVSLKLPGNLARSPVEFLAKAEALSVEIDTPAKVIINERTGTIVMGKDVSLQPTSILHGALTVEVTTTFEVSQPEPLSNGETRTVPNIGVGVKADPAKHVSLKRGASVEDLVRSLLAIGSTPRDVIAILQALKAAGALQAEVEVI
jgi:flagellar P-ring protein FlgI